MIKWELLFRSSTFRFSRRKACEECCRANDLNSSQVSGRWSLQAYLCDYPCRAYLTKPAQPGFKSFGLTRPSRGSPRLSSSVIHFRPPEVHALGPTPQLYFNDESVPKHRDIAIEKCGQVFSVSLSESNLAGGFLSNLSSFSLHLQLIRLLQSKHLDPKETFEYLGRIVAYFIWYLRSYCTASWQSIRLKS